MSEPITVELIVERFPTNKLNEAKVQDQIKAITNACLNRPIAKGVEVKKSKFEGPVEVVHNGATRKRYSFVLTLTRAEYKSEAAAQATIEAAQKLVSKEADTQGWSCLGNLKDVEAKATALENRAPLVLPPLDEEAFGSIFGHIKERASHIRLMYKSLETFIETDREERNHTLLYGRPAAAKTILIKTFKYWLELDDGVERITMLNATTLSKAGLESWILDKAQTGLLPEILWINELEKGSPDDFLCLLNIMDEQGKISRLNSKIGKQEGEAKILVWADCNDEEKLRNWNKGALWSRFNKRWPCVRPSRPVMRQILIDMLEKRKAKGQPMNFKWADAAIDYAFDVMKTDDPREIKGLMDGGDDLLNGKYFKDIEAVKAAQKMYQAMTGVN